MFINHEYVISFSILHFMMLHAALQAGAPHVTVIERDRRFLPFLEVCVITHRAITDTDEFSLRI